MHAIRISHPSSTNGVSVVSKGMKLVGSEVKLHLDTCAPLFPGGSALVLVCSFSLHPSVSLPQQFLGVEAITELSTKVTEGGPKGFREFVERGQCVVSMEPKLGVGMPGGKEENEIKGILFILIRR